MSKISREETKLLKRLLKKYISRKVAKALSGLSVGQEGTIECVLQYGKLYGYIRAKGKQYNTAKGEVLYGYRLVFDAYDEDTEPEIDIAGFGRLKEIKKKIGTFSKIYVSRYGSKGLVLGNKTESKSLSEIGRQNDKLKLSLAASIYELLNTRLMASHGIKTDSIDIHVAFLGWIELKPVGSDWCLTHISPTANFNKVVATGDTVFQVSYISRPSLAERVKELVDWWVELE